MKNDRLYLILVLGMLMVILAWLIAYNKTVEEIKNEGVDICTTFLKVC